MEARRATRPSEPPENSKIIGMKRRAKVAATEVNRRSSPPIGLGSLE
jgi:hypothetical protein